MTDRPEPDADCLAITAAHLYEVGEFPGLDPALDADRLRQARHLHRLARVEVADPEPPTITRMTVTRNADGEVVAIPVGGQPEGEARAARLEPVFVVGDGEPRFEGLRCRGTVFAVYGEQDRGKTEHVPIPSAVERRVDMLIDALRVVREHLTNRDIGDDVRLHDIARTVNLEGVRDILDRRDAVAYALTGMPEVAHGVTIENDATGERVALAVGCEVPRGRWVVAAPASLSAAITGTKESPTFLAERLLDGRRLSAEQAAHIHRLVDAADTSDAPREWVHRDVLIEAVECERSIREVDHEQARRNLDELIRTRELHDAAVRRADAARQDAERVAALAGPPQAWLDTKDDVALVAHYTMHQPAASQGQIVFEAARRLAEAVGIPTPDPVAVGVWSDEPPLPPCPNCMTNPCSVVGVGGAREWCEPCKLAFRKGSEHGRVTDGDGRPQTVADWRDVIDKRRPLHVTIEDIAWGIIDPRLGEIVGREYDRAAVLAVIDRLDHSRAKWPEHEGGFNVDERRGILAAEVCEVVAAERAYTNVDDQDDEAILAARADLRGELLDVGAVALRWYIAEGGDR